MRTLLAITVAAVASCLLLTTASAGPPPPLIAHIAVTHTRPVAGHRFTGLTVTSASTTASTSKKVSCDAVVVNRANLRAKRQKFYEEGVQGGPAVVTCSWKIPASARGTLSVQAAVSSTQGTVVFPVVSWRIKR